MSVVTSVYMYMTVLATSTFVSILYDISCYTQRRQLEFNFINQIFAKRLLSSN